MNASTIVTAIVAITVGVIITSTVLIPAIQDAIGTTEAPGVAADYAGLLGVVIVMVIIAIVMMAVRLMGSRN